MKKFLLVVITCVLSLTASIEALAWSEGADFPGVLVAAARMRKKAPAKKKANPKKSWRDDEDFVHFCGSGTPEKVRDKLLRGANANAETGNGMTALMNAVRLNNTEVVSILLEAGANVNAKNKSRDFDRGMTALMYAADYRGDPKDIPTLLTILLNAGADVNAKENYDKTALMFAAGNREAKTVIPVILPILLKAGANVNAKSYDGETALMYAARYNKNPEIFSILLNAGADVNAKDKNGNTVLIGSAWKNDPEVISTLLKAGADVNAKDKDGKTALMSAASGNENPEVISLLLNAGADVNAKEKHGATALMAAAYSNTPEVVSILLEAGADANAKDQEGYTPLMITTKGDKKYEEASKIISLLVNAGADVNARNNKGQTARDLARNWKSIARVLEVAEQGYKRGKESVNEDFFNLCKNGSIYEIRRALEVGTYVDSKNKRGATALMAASGNNPDPEVITALIEAGADINAHCLEDGSTPLMWAAEKNNINAIYKLIEAGADINVKDYYGQTALFWAVMKNPSPEATSTLIQAGANMNEKINNGVTLLMAAAGNTSSPEIISTLLQAGADINAKDKERRTALDWAAMHNPNLKILEALLQAGLSLDAQTKEQRGTTTLMRAAANNPNPEVIKFLIQAGADVNDGDWNTRRHYSKALMGAAWHNSNPEIITALIEAGADVNIQGIDGITALIAAAEFNSSPEIIARLVEAGADVNMKDWFKGTALDYARQNEKLKDTDAVKILEEAKLRPIIRLSRKQFKEFEKICEDGSLEKFTAKLEQENISPNATFRGEEYENIDHSLLTLASAATSNVEIIKFLLSKGADIHKETSGYRDLGPEMAPVTQMTALMKAVQGDRPEIVKTLLDAGLDVNAKDSENMTALDWALETYSSQGIIRILLDAGADVKNSLPFAFNDGVSSPEVLKMLIEAGADVNAKGCEELLIWAAINTESPEVIEILLNAGANAKTKTKTDWLEGKRAIDFARDNPNLKGTNALKMLDEASYDSEEEREKEKAEREAALQSLAQKAEQGDEQALQDIAHIYWSGKGDIEDDGQKTVYWLKKVAAQNDDWAMYALEKIYRNGMPGVEKDEKEADVWYQKAEAIRLERVKRLGGGGDTFKSNGSIAGDKVNVRTEPNTSAKVVKQLNTGHPIKASKKKGDWYFIQTASGTKGWVFGKYVKLK